MAEPSARAIRTRLGMSQSRFSVAFGIPLSTLRGWEQGRKSPDGAARVLLMVIERAPDAVLAAAASCRPQAA